MEDIEAGRLYIVPEDKSKPLSRSNHIFVIPFGTMMNVKTHEVKIMCTTVLSHDIIECDPDELVDLDPNNNKSPDCVIYSPKIAESIKGKPVRNFNIPVFKQTTTFQIEPEITIDEYNALGKLLDMCLDSNDVDLCKNISSLRNKLEPYKEFNYKKDGVR